MKSLDPRVLRLPVAGEAGVIHPKAPLDQFGSFEVFVQPKAGKAFQHEGIVHAPNLEMAFLLSKEAFTRRFTCTSLYVVETRNVYVSPTTDGTTNAYDLVATGGETGPSEPYEIYHLLRRGKQHVHVGTVQASGHQDAMIKAKEQFKGPVVNLWAIRRSDFRFTADAENDLWNTLPEKKFRDAAEYRGGDKLKNFLEKQKNKV